MPHRVDAPVQAMKSSHLCRLGDRAPPVTEPGQLPRGDHPVLPGREVRQGLMPSPLSFVTHRVTKDYGLVISPLPRVQVGDRCCRSPRSMVIVEEKPKAPLEPPPRELSLIRVVVLIVVLCAVGFGV